MDSCAVQQWQTQHPICEAFSLKVARHCCSCDFLLSCIYCLQCVPLRRITLKSNRETHFSLLLWIHLTLACVSWDFTRWGVQHTPTPTRCELTQTEAARAKLICTFTQTRPLYATQSIQWLHCGPVFSSGWWQVFFSTHMVKMKSNYICNGSPTLLLLWRSQRAWVTAVGPKCAQ